MIPLELGYTKKCNPFGMLFGELLLKHGSTMSENNQSREVTTGGANYIGWRGELLAELSLARVPNLSVHKPNEDCGYDFLVASPRGECFLVQVKAFSSKRLNIHDVDQIKELRYRIDLNDVLRVKESNAPVFLFLIDADTEHGRYVRLDTTHVETKSSNRQLLRLPRENSIDKKGIEKLIASLHEPAKAVPL